MIAANKHYRFTYFLYQLIVIFIFFDGIRSNSIFRNSFTLVREAVVVLLLIQCYIQNRYKIYGVIHKTVIIFMLYHAFICFMTLLLPGMIQTSFMVKPFYLLFGIYLFYYFQELTNKSYDDLFRFAIYVAVAFVCINTLLYFVPTGIITKQQMWWGRVSVGYPTMDVITLAYALCILLFYPNLGIKGFLKPIFILTIIFGIMLNFSGTGIVALSLILATALLTSGIVKNRKVLLTSALIVIVFLPTALTYLSYNYESEYKDGSMLIGNKINIILENDVQTNTLEIRYEQYEKISRQMTTIEKVFGRSLINASNDAKMLKQQGVYMIENQYDFCRSAYGYVGLSLYILMIVAYAYNILKTRLTTYIKILLLLSAMILAINSRTLIILVLFPNYMFISLFMGYFQKIRNGENYVG